MKISLTKNDIKYGVKGDKQSCAIARNVQRSFPGDRISVDVAMVSVKEYIQGLGFITWTWKLPKKAQAFILRFDDERIPKSKVNPISFTMRRAVSGT